MLQRMVEFSGRLCDLPEHVILLKREFTAHIDLRIPVLRKGNTLTQFTQSEHLYEYDLVARLYYMSEYTWSSEGIPEGKSILR